MRFVYRWIAESLILVASLLSPWNPGHTELGQREQIGEVLGRPVYRDEIRKGESRVDELNRLFLAPVMAKYRLEHNAEITPSAMELEATTKFFDEQHAERMKEEGPALRDELRDLQEQLQREELTADEGSKLDLQKSILEHELTPPGAPFAEFLLVNWKFQRHIYDKFGGGRVLWQQGGLEAVDAMRTLIETREKEGAFKVTDLELRDRLYAEWTSLESDPYLIKDQERIRAEFLEPAWAPIASK